MSFEGSFFINRPIYLFSSPFSRKQGAFYARSRDNLVLHCVRCPVGRCGFKGCWYIRLQPRGQLTAGLFRSASDPFFSGPPTVLATDLLKLDSRSPRRAGFHGPGMKGRCFVAARPHCERPTKEMLCRTPLFQRSGTDSRSACGLGTKKDTGAAFPAGIFPFLFFMVLRVPCAGEQPRERSCLHTASLSWGGEV